MRAVDAGVLVERAWQVDDAFAAGDEVWTLAAGKAAPAMFAAAARQLGTRLHGGLVVTHPDTLAAAGALRDAVPGVTWLAGSHPTPTDASLAAGRRALDLVAGLPGGARLLVLLSGGTSSLLAVPAAGLGLDDKRETTARLLRAGADIAALNAVRKHLSAIKGGRLAQAARVPLRTLAISDVVTDDPSVIGSGPTVADPSTFGDALAVLTRYGPLDAYPRVVIAHLEKGHRGGLPETLKPGDPAFHRSSYVLAGGRADAMAGAARAARELGYAVEILESAIVGEARDAARACVARLLEAAAAGGRRCIISSGETTVTVTGDGRGGRNQEFALAAATPLASCAYAAVLASVGTDGVDGASDAAGALVDVQTLSRAARHHLDAADFLARNDSNTFFAALGDLIETGPTGTNVGDLQVALVDGSQRRTLQLAP